MKQTSIFSVILIFSHNRALVEKQINQQQNRNRQQCNSLHRVFKNKQKATVCREQIFHISGKKKDSPNLIKGSLQTQGNKKDLVNEGTQWFRRNLWAKDKCSLEGPKAALLVGQLCSREPAMSWGNSCVPRPPPYLHKSDRSRGPRTHVALPVVMCLYHGAAPGAKEEEFPDIVLTRLHQKIAGSQQRTSTFRISCV